MLDGRPGCGNAKNGTSAPHIIQASPWPPVWLRIVIEISIDGPAPPAHLGLLDTEVGAACFAHGRDARRERARHALGGKVEVQSRTASQKRHRVEVAVAHEVHVAVDEPGQTVRPSQSIVVVAVEAGPDSDDAAVLDHDIAGAGAAPLPSNTSPPAAQSSSDSTVPCGGRRD